MTFTVNKDEEENKAFKNNDGIYLSNKNHK